MRWLVHGSLSSAADEALRRHEHTVRRPAEIELDPSAPPAQVLAAAQRLQLDVITADGAVATAPFAEDAALFQRSIVFLNVDPGDASEDDAIDRLFTRYSRLTPGRLYTVTGSRVKIRQLPTAGRAAAHTTE